MKNTPHLDSHHLDEGLGRELHQGTPLAGLGRELHQGTPLAGLGHEVLQGTLCLQITSKFAHSYVDIGL